MAHVENGGSPPGALEPRRNTQQEAGGAGATLSALFTREQQGGKERSYEEMVALIKGAAEKERERLGDYCFDPALWIRDQIIGANTRRAIAENIPDDVELGAWPYAKIIMAWDIISVPYYKPMYHTSKSNAEAGIRARAKVLGNTITLDQKESMLLDAMAEAVGIPNPFGQSPQEKKG